MNTALAAEGKEVPAYNLRVLRTITVLLLLTSRTAGVASVTGAHYEGGHWVGCFAVYLVTARGLSK
jgi:hypothetical protein